MSAVEDMNPNKLLTREIVETALKNDLGSEWSLGDFEIKDFTNKGDNYCTKVTSICGNGSKNDKEKKVYYIAKLNHLNSMGPFDVVIEDVFIKEGGFLTDVAIKLNEILHDINYALINFPECIFFTTKKKEQILLTKDLRQRGFKMFDRKIGMDVAHATLVIKELAKLHAASVIFKGRLDKKTVLDIYPYLRDFWLNDSDVKESFTNMFGGNIDMSINLLENVEGYEKQIRWLETLKDTGMDIYYNSLIVAPDNMKVICHGDCWNNNVLFRYDDSDNPTDIYLLDLQLCRYGSVGLDLSYFMYSSLTGEVRNAHQSYLVSTYYEEFENVLKAANQTMPFTQEELWNEFKDKAIFGILSGLTMLPFLICEGNEIPDLASSTEFDAENFQKEYAALASKSLESNPMFKPRFLALFDDVIKIGMIGD